jgi:REase_DpnII-MboI/Family of unknown function (DUF5763)
MTINTCKATTSKGKNCVRKADSSWYCKQHEELDKKMTTKSQYDEVLNTILKTCNTKGWSAYVTSNDDEYQFITIKVKQYFDYEQIEGILDVTISNKELSYSIQNTSFHNYWLNTLLKAISLKFEELSWVERKNGKDTQKSNIDPWEILATILKNFDKSARQIKKRYNGRATMDIKDEYDVQDLLHSILRAYFDDVRPEESVPSYAWSNSRVDFLLKKERIVIEVKFASEKLKEKEIGNQLIIDIKKYQTHQDCEQLYCLVYDQNNEIRNPIGLERDLSWKHDKIEVKVFIVPK